MKQYKDDVTDVELIDYFDQWVGPLKRFITMADKHFDDGTVTVQEVVEPAKLMMQTFIDKMHTAFETIKRDVGKVSVNVANFEWLEGNVESAAIEMIPPVRSEVTQ